MGYEPEPASYPAMRPEVLSVEVVGRSVVRSVVRTGTNFTFKVSRERVRWEI